MRKIATMVLMLVIMGITAFGVEPGDTASVVDFTLTEQSITLKIGESRQLYTNPADAKVRWMNAWDFSVNPVALVDDNGVVTALRAGSLLAQAESLDASVSRMCQITVLDEGCIRKNTKKFYPTNECEWTDVKFSLADDGNFTVNGVFYGSGAQTNYLHYVVTDLCIFLWFEINYEDSTRMFYPQPFSLEISDCNAQEYNVYLNNRVQVVESQGSFVKYAVSRGSSSGTTNMESILLKKDDDVIYNLKGQKMESIPEEGVYIQNGIKRIVK